MDRVIATRTLEIRKDDWTKLRLVEAEVDAGLGADEAWLRIDRFALTANNISYCLAGDMLGYWGFFPAGEGWGRVPVMGYADVIASTQPEVAVGERVWGFFPMGTHLRIRVGKVQPHAFADLSAHRQPYSPLYAQYLRSAANPWYEPAREDQDLLLRGMHLTGWLLEDYLHDNAGFGARAVVVSSASSKTAIAFAHRAHERGERALLALTSARNRDFVASLGCYDRVLGYDEVGLLDATQPSALVDFAGDATLTARLHHHFGERLRHSASVGATHHDRGGATADLPGPAPEFFFAPGQMQKRGAEWGAGEVERRLMEHFARFRVWCDGWLCIERAYGADAAIAAFEQLRSGRSSPATGHVLSLWPAR